MSEKEPLLTIGIPFYNSQGTLLDAIRSIFAQTFHDWELLLVDDGSSDGSLRIAQGVQDHRVHVLSDGRNLGLSARLNQVADLARGKYLVRMDADDLSAPNRIETLVTFLEAHPEVSVVGSGMLILGSDGKPVGKRIPPTQHRDILSDCYSGIKLAHATVAASHAWFQSHRYDRRLQRSQDYDLWMRSRNDACFANIPELLYFCAEFKSFSVSNYLKDSHTVGRVAWRHAVHDVGPFRALGCITKLCAKVGVYLIADAMGLADKLIRKRSMPLAHEDSSFFLNAMAQISATEVPVRRP